MQDDDSIIVLPPMRKELSHSGIKPSTVNSRAVQELYTSPQEAAITPLPYGKVLNDCRLQCGQYHYYQVEVEASETVLTVHLQCTKGIANMYLARGYLPSYAKYDHIANGDLKSRMCRITFATKHKGTHMITVYSPLKDSIYSIWSFCSGASATEVSSIKHVGDYIKKFNLLTSHSDAELSMHFPRLEQEAAQKVSDDEKNVIVTRSKVQVLDEMRDMEKNEPEKYAKIMDQDPSSLTEVESEQANMDKFVTKVGRYAMRQELQAVDYAKKHSLVAYNLLYDMNSPNFHADLFTQPVFRGNSDTKAILDMTGIIEAPPSDRHHHHNTHHRHSQLHGELHLSYFGKAGISHVEMAPMRLDQGQDTRLTPIAPISQDALSIGSTWSDISGGSIVSARTKPSSATVLSKSLTATRGDSIRKQSDASRSREGDNRLRIPPLTLEEATEQRLSSLVKATSKTNAAAKILESIPPKPNPLLYPIPQHPEYSLKKYQPKKVSLK